LRIPIVEEAAAGAAPEFLPLWTAFFNGSDTIP
jgi:hypothetical protein